MTVGILSTDSFGRFSFPIVAAIERRRSTASRSSYATPPTIRRASGGTSINCSASGSMESSVTARRIDRREPIEPAAPGLPVIYVFCRVEDPEAFVFFRTTKEGRSSLSATLPLWGEDASPRSPGRSGSRPFACATTVIAQRSWKPGCRRYRPCRAAGRRPGSRGRAETVLAAQGRARRAVLRQRPDRARRDRSPARDGPRRSRGRGGGRLRVSGT